MDDEEGHRKTDVRLSKFMSKSRENIVIETKTTTTTTTVTKRIRIANDANIDLTNIHALLDMDEKTGAIGENVDVLPNANDISKKAIVKRASKSSPNASQIPLNRKNQSFLSSTKIDGFDENSVFHESNKKRSISPNLSKKNPDAKHFKGTNKNSNQTVKTMAKISKKNLPTDNTEKKKDKLTNVKKDAKRSTRSKKSINNSKDNSKYIDGLINQYMVLEKNPRKNDIKSINTTEKSKKQRNETPPAIASKDLSAIFEISGEIFVDSPVQSKRRRSDRNSTKTTKKSSIDFRGINNDIDDEYYIPPFNNHSPSISPIEPSNEPDSKGASKDTKRKRIEDFIDTEKSKKPERNSKKPIEIKKSVESKKPVDTKKSIEKKKSVETKKSIETKKPIDMKKPIEIKKPIETKKPLKRLQSSDGKSKISNENMSPIKIYSPSARGKFHTDIDNRLVLTKKMLEKTLQEYPKSSKSMLKRLGQSNKMTVDANSRLMYYPSKDDKQKPSNNNTDMLMFLKQTSKPLLVKEIYTE